MEEGAVAQDRLNLCRAARSYLAAIRARQEQGEASRPAPELAVQLLLNRRDPAAALAKVDEALAAQPDRASLVYLKALACAQQGHAQESAEALARALAAGSGPALPVPPGAGLRRRAPFRPVRRAGSVKGVSSARMAHSGPPFDPRLTPGRSPGAAIAGPRAHG